MVYTSTKRKLKEKPNYDTSLYRKVKTPTTTPTKAAADNIMMFASPDDEEKPAWSESQKEYASDYMARVLERYANNLDVYNDFIEVLRKYVWRETEMLVAWHGVCNLLYESPDLCDEFLNFMGPRYRYWTSDGDAFAEDKYQGEM